MLNARQERLASGMLSFVPSQACEHDRLVRQQVQALSNLHPWPMEHHASVCMQRCACMWHVQICMLSQTSKGHIPQNGCPAFLS